jgi:hypothetical protein
MKKSVPGYGTDQAGAARDARPRQENVDAVGVRLHQTAFAALLAVFVDVSIHGPAHHAVAWPFAVLPAAFVDVSIHGPAHHAVALPVAT